MLVFGFYELLSSKNGKILLLGYLRPRNEAENFQKLNFIIFNFSQKADLAICDLTITYERRTAVDFTMPFMTLGEYIK